MASGEGGGFRLEIGAPSGVLQLGVLRLRACASRLPTCRGRGAGPPAPGGSRQRPCGCHSARVRAHAHASGHARCTDWHAGQSACGHARCIAALRAGPAAGSSQQGGRGLSVLRQRETSITGMLRVDSLASRMHHSDAGPIGYRQLATALSTSKSDSAFILPATPRIPTPPGAAHLRVILWGCM